jgi:MoaA/NifB/PqqE/SkfB family radical SAM enzyme
MRSGGMKKGHSKFLIEKIAYSPAFSRLAFAAIRNGRWLRFPFYRFLLRRQIEAVKRRNGPFPLVVAAENTNICNAKCLMCPYPTMRRRKGFMDMTLFCKIVDECAAHPGVELRLTGFGEPLLDKKLVQRIEYAKGKGIEKVQLTTNASLLDKDTAAAIINSGLDEIMFSVDGYDRESYERVRGGLSFDKVHENLRLFRRIRGENRKPRTIASIICFDEYRGHRKEIIRLWRDCADRLFVKPPEDWAGEASGFNERTSGKKTHIPCPYLWTQFLITWDGAVGLCCRDFCNIRISIGNVNRESISDVWHGATLERLRATDALGRTLPPCLRCAYSPNWWGER